MTIDWHLVAQVAIPIFSLLLGAAFERITERKSKVVLFYGHVAAHTIRPTETEPIVINTHSVVIRNEGRKAAKNVRVRHHYLPPNYTIQPARSWTRNPVPTAARKSSSTNSSLASR